MLLQTLQNQYICPGESHPISRAVHLSRLASYYPACRECPFRDDPESLVRTPGPTESPSVEADRNPLPLRHSVFGTEGVRGVWRNELTRARASDIAAAFASLLWDLAAEDERAAPMIVVGHDARPSAPDIVTGVASALRLMGCEVIDIGLATRPALWFAVDHLDASGGVHVTGSGRPPSWTGVDFVGRQGTPLSVDRPESEIGLSFNTPLAPTGSPRLSLRRIEERLGQPFLRPARDARPQRTFQAAVPYEAGLLQHFHALRPLTVRWASSVRLVQQTVERLFESLPCRLQRVEIPDRARDVCDEDDEDVQRVGAAVRESTADLGILMDDDGQRCAFLDDRGSLVPVSVMTRLLARRPMADGTSGIVVLPETVDPTVQAEVERHGGRVVLAAPELQRISEAIREHQADWAAGLDGRYWFRENFAACDALITLARGLDLLSQSDRPFSEIAATATP
jgi:phosphomannomutase